MIYLTKFLYNTFLLPPGIFIVLLVALAIWLYRRERKAAIALLSIATLMYLLSIPIISDFLIKSLEDKYHPPAVTKGDVIVMLGGGAFTGTPDIDGNGNLSGASANRLLATARLYNKTGLPVIISGGKLYKDSGSEAVIARRELIGLGIPAGKIIAEDKSRNTLENAQNTLKILKTHHFKKPILVTSAFHMRRSVINFRKFGVAAQPYPTDYMSDYKSSLHLKLFTPSYNSLYSSSTAIREYLGILVVNL